MFLGFVFSCCFSLAYSAYWLLGMLGVRITDEIIQLQFDSYGKISSMVQIVGSMFTSLLLLGYVFYLKVQFNMTKDQITIAILYNHKKKLLSFELFNLLIAISILVSIMCEDIQQEQDYIMIHSLILCTISFTRLYKACKLYGIFRKSICLQLLYFFTLAGIYGFLIHLDLNLSSENNHLSKDDIGSNLALNTQLLYLELLLSNEKLALQLFLKVIEYFFISQAAQIFFGSRFGQNGKASFEDIISISVWCLIALIFIKDLILLTKWITEQTKNCIRNKKEARRQIALHIYLNSRLEHQKDENLNKTQEILSLSTCSICLESNNNESVRLECPHSYHINCAIQWLKRSPNCPLCQAPVTLQNV